MFFVLNNNNGIILAGRTHLFTHSFALHTCPASQLTCSSVFVWLIHICSSFAFCCFCLWANFSSFVDFVERNCNILPSSSSSHSLTFWTPFFVVCLFVKCYKLPILSHHFCHLFLTHFYAFLFSTIVHWFLISLIYI